MDNSLPVNQRHEKGYKVSTYIINSDGQISKRREEPSFVNNLNPRQINFKPPLVDQSNPKAFRRFIYNPTNDNLINFDRSITVSPMMVTNILDNSIAVLNKGGLGNSVLKEFAASNNIKINDIESYLNHQYNLSPILWGTLRGSQSLINLRQYANLPYIYFDHAYFKRGHEFENYRIAVNSRFAPPVQNLHWDRFKKFNLVVKDWRQTGSHILVCPPALTALTNSGQYEWLNKTVALIRKYSDRKIVVKTKEVRIENTFKDCWVVVTDKSNIAIEAYLSGIPVITTSESIYSYAGNNDLANIESPTFGDRLSLFYWLAYHQFSIEEIRSGLATEILSDVIG